VLAEENVQVSLVFRLFTSRQNSLVLSNRASVSISMACVCSSQRSNYLRTKGRLFYLNVPRSKQFSSRI
jgi:hypothetical protein